MSDLYCHLSFPCPKKPNFHLGALVRKKSGSEWEGRIVGFYSTKLTPVGWAVESSSHAGSVQIYPETALERVGGWVPDGRNWIEVPDHLMESPLAYGVMCSVLNKNERSNKAYASLMSNSCDPDWSLHPSHPIRIVAYTLEEPEDKEKPWYPDDRNWVEVSDGATECPVDENTLVDTLFKEERENLAHDDSAPMARAGEWFWDIPADSPYHIVAYTTEPKA